MHPSYKNVSWPTTEERAAQKLPSLVARIEKLERVVAEQDEALDYLKTLLRGFGR